MIGYGLDRRGPKDSETAPNSFLTKINGEGYWQFGTDMNGYDVGQAVLITRSTSNQFAQLK